MIKLEIIPAIDIMNGKCIRLKQGKPSEIKQYSNNPLKVAEDFINQGANRLHIVDIDAALGRMPNTQTIKELIRELSVKVQIAGGIRSLLKAKLYLKIGASRVIYGTTAINNPEIVEDSVKKLGSEKILVAIDEKDDKVAIKGWKQITEENYINFAKKLEDINVGAIILTSIERDGMLLGPNIEKIATIRESVNLPIIASGGVGTINDLFNLSKLGLEGVIIGTAIYENNFSVKKALEVSQSVS